MVKIMVRSVKFENYSEETAKKVLQFLAVTYGKTVLDTLQEIVVTFKDSPGVAFTFVGNIPEMLNQASAVQKDLLAFQHDLPKVK